MRASLASSASWVSMAVVDTRLTLRGGTSQEATA